MAKCKVRVSYADMGNSRKLAKQVELINQIVLEAEATQAVVRNWGGDEREEMYVLERKLENLRVLAKAAKWAS